jgi:succinate-acetate transporter protein
MFISKARRENAISNQEKVLPTRSAPVVRAPPAPPTALGNPGPLGLGAFALTTFMLSVFNANSNLIDSRVEAVVLPVALFYGGIAQFAAGMWEYRINNTFGATAFTSYGCFWMSFAAYVYYIVPTLTSNGAKAYQATGLFLLSWLIFTFYMCIAAFRVSRVLFLLFVVLCITFILLIVGALVQKPVVTNVGGWFGIVTAFIAWYGSAGVMINTTWGRSMCPLGLHKVKVQPTD